MKTIGIIGAGLSGIVSAKTCLEYGYAIKVFEKDTELGGVWSSSRRYPGVTTQNTKDTYAFSDLPMPKYFGEWPSGEEVQSYLRTYAEKFNVFPFIKFSHKIDIVHFEKNQWVITGRNQNGSFIDRADFLIICNGTFSEPFIPSLTGMDSFVSAGGKILHSSQFNSTEISRDKRLVVVGYSKSAGDIVTLASNTTISAHLVYREPKWKIPRYVKGINMKYLLLNRLGEALIKPADQYNKMERFLGSTGLPGKMLSFVEKYITKKHMLVELGLLPSSRIKDQAFGEITLETPHFFEHVKAGKIIYKTR
ncbi:MAG: NAD(P)/FAD-dependent oxidoreductase [Chitinophagaceae bacterium]